MDSGSWAAAGGVKECVEMDVNWTISCWNTALSGGRGGNIRRGHQQEEKKLLC